MATTCIVMFFLEKKTTDQKTCWCFYGVVNTNIAVAFAASETTCKILSETWMPKYRREGDKHVSIAEHLYRDTKIAIMIGDITKLEVDAIVNPANSQLIMGGGVAGAILRAGGDQIQKQALKKAPIPIGRAVATTAGKLKAKYVIHAPTMTRPAKPASLEDIRAATRGALACAQQMGLMSLAFPGLGTGVGGLDPQDAANAMVEEMKRHIEAGTSFKKVILVGYKRELANALEEAASRLM